MGYLWGTTCVIWTAIFKKYYRLLKYCLKWCIFGKWCNLVMKERPTRTRKISLIARRRDEPTGKYYLFSNRRRKVTRRAIKIFAAYELFRIVWFFIWYNANKNQTCIAKVTRRWSGAEMTRKSVNVYVVFNETLFYPYEFEGVLLQFGWKKKYISEFWKSISIFQKYSWLLFYGNLYL